MVGQMDPWPFPPGINNEFDFATGGDPADPYQFDGYDHVARYLSNNDILGNAGSLPSGQVSMGVHSYTFNPIPASFVDDVNKAHAVVMIVNSETGEILNAQIASIQSDASIAEMNNDFELNLYPNPASEKLVVSFDVLGEQNTYITITDVLGNQVMHLKKTFPMNETQNLVLDTSTLSSGVYVLSMRSGKYTSNQKFSISH